jgi:hypothetical protein
VFIFYYIDSPVLEETVGCKKSALELAFIKVNQVVVDIQLCFDEVSSEK